MSDFFTSEDFFAVADSIQMKDIQHLRKAWEIEKAWESQEKRNEDMRLFQMTEEEYDDSELYDKLWRECGYANIDTSKLSQEDAEAIQRERVRRRTWDENM